jgi:HEAT repeat protein
VNAYDYNCERPSLALKASSYEYEKGGNPMAKDILEQLCDLLKAPDAELQCAAAKVLGALKVKDEGPRKALVGAFRAANPMVVAYAVDALGRMGDAVVLPDLVAAFAAPQQAREKALAAVAGFGTAALPALREALAHKDLNIRRGAAEALGRIAGDAALEGLLGTVRDADEETVRIAVGHLRKRIEGMGEKDRDALLARARKMLDTGAVKKSPRALSALLKLLGFLRRPSAVPDLLVYVDRKLPAEARRNALVSLAHLDLGGVDAKAVTARLLPLLGEEDFAQIVSPALSVLWKVPVPKAMASKVMALQKSPHGPVRAFATRALGTVGTAEAADALLAGLAAADFRDREMAANSLRASPAFAPKLAAALEKAKDPAQAWAIAGVLRGYREGLDKALAKKLVARAAALLAKSDEERAKAFLEAGRHAVPDAARAALLKGGMAWLKKGRFEVAEGFLRHFERDDASTPEGLYGLAVARFKRGTTALDASAHGKNPGLPLFARLVRLGGFPVAKRLAADRKLFTPQDLLYLGFFFVEQPGAERTFGAEALKVLLKAHPKSAEAKSARQRLTTEGF